MLLIKQLRLFVSDDPYGKSKTVENLILDALSIVLIIGK
jgi:hypothetical protein